MTKAARSSLRVVSPFNTFLLVLAVVFCSAALPGAVSSSHASVNSATFYVSTSGQDSNPGTLALPWRTPQHAVDAMAPGDTTFVRAGTYTGQTTCSGSSGDGGSAAGGYVSLKAYASDTPVLNGAVDGIVKISCDYFTVEGFDIAGPAVVGGTNIYPTSGSDHIRIVGNDIHGSICQGISMDPNTADYEILGNRIHHNGVQSQGCDQQAHGLYLQGDRHLVNNNLFYDNHDYGIQAYPYGRNSVIAYNVSTHNGKAGIVMGGGGSGPSGTGVAGMMLIANIFSTNSTYGVHVAAPRPFHATSTATWSTRTAQVESSPASLPVASAPTAPRIPCSSTCPAATCT